MFDYVSPFDDAPPPAPIKSGSSSQAPDPLAELLKGLNPQQAMAVQHTEGPLLVLAGAGTGKTSVLTRRIAYILQTRSAYPEQVLAVTFTNKAAKEMAERTEKLAGTSTHGMWLGTFHRLGVRFLRAHAEAAGLKQSFVILDTDDQTRLVTQLVKDAGLDIGQYPARQVTAAFNSYKDKGLTPDLLSLEDHQAVGGNGGKLYAEYQRRLLALNAVDFGDLLLHPLTVLKKNSDILKRYQDQFKYILVDEYQDTNGVQYQWLKLVADGHKNICVVGDDDQSIYAWRGAQVGNILRFEQDFPGAEVIRLEQNYRSTGHILAGANGVIANNRDRHGKALWTDAGDGEQIQLHPLLDDREESRFVADKIASYVRGGMAYSDIAVLVRSGAQTRSLEEQFIKAGLPYIIVGGLKFYERKEVKDALGYLRLIANSTDDLALARIVNVPKRGIGDTTMAGIQANARERSRSLEASTRAMLSTGELHGRIGNAIGGLMQNLDTWRLLAQTDTPDRLTERVLEDSGYLDMLRNDKEDDAKSRIDNLKELVRALQDYPTLEAFLDHVALVTDDSADLDDAVRLTTIHAAKGLEFHTVFLPGFEEGLFPHQRSINEDGLKGLEEERRLAYVALTRAKHRLLLTHTHGRRIYGQFIPGAPSRFVKEIPEQHIKIYPSTGGLSGGGWGYGQYGSNNSYGGGSFSQRPAVGSRSDFRSNRTGTDYARPAEPLISYEHVSQVNPFEDDAGDGTLRPGQSVFHQKFGSGIVQSVEGSGETAMITVTFKAAGKKKLMAGMANLQIK